MFPPTSDAGAIFCDITARLLISGNRILGNSASTWGDGIRCGGGRGAVLNPGST